jgi:hypothetical protein
MPILLPVSPFFHHVGDGKTDLRPPYIVTCDKCGHSRTYFCQLQIRSADESMTMCACLLLIGLAKLGADLCIVESVYRPVLLVRLLIVCLTIEFQMCWMCISIA